MIFEVFTDGMFESNSYLIGDSGEGAVIDAGAPPEKIAGAAERHGLKIKYILLTHGHIDHICSVDAIRRIVGGKAAIHRSEARALTDPAVNLSAFFSFPESFEAADMELDGGEKLKVGNIEVEVIHTPGHTPGGVCFKAGSIVFTGDTLFEMSIGRTDFPGGDASLLLRSIREKLLTLDDDTRVFPGHGNPTSIGREKRINIFLRKHGET